MDTSDLEVRQSLINRHVLEFLQGQDEERPLLLGVGVFGGPKTVDLTTDGCAGGIGDLLGLDLDFITINRNTGDGVGLWQLGLRHVEAQLEFRGGKVLEDTV